MRISDQIIRIRISRWMSLQDSWDWHFAELALNR